MLDFINIEACRDSKNVLMRRICDQMSALELKLKEQLLVFEGHSICIYEMEPFINNLLNGEHNTSHPESLNSINCRCEFRTTSASGARS